MGWNSQNITQLLIITAGGGFTGLFVYSPAPGPGNLIASIAPVSGTDPYGNPYQPVVEIQGTAGQKLFLNFGGTGFPGIGFATGAPEENAQAAVFEEILSPGVSEQLALAVFGPSSAGGPGSPGIVFVSAAKDGSVPAYGWLVSGNTPFLQWAHNQGLVQFLADGKAGGIPASQRDNFSRTANAAGLTQIGFGYNVPANEVVAGMEGFTYRMKASGTGTWSNLSSGALQLLAYGSSRAIQSFAFSTAFFANGDSFEWNAEIDTVVTTVGAAGTANITGWLQMVDTVAKVSFVMSLNALITPFTVDTTSASQLRLNWSWAGTGGSITCATTELNRIPCTAAS